MAGEFSSQKRLGLRWEVERAYELLTHYLIGCIDDVIRTISFLPVLSRGTLIRLCFVCFAICVPLRSFIEAPILTLRWGREIPNVLIELYFTRSENKPSAASSTQTRNPVRENKRLCIRALVFVQQTAKEILDCVRALRSIGTDMPVSIEFLKGFCLTFQAFCL
jgi:hypothetical protein